MIISATLVLSIFLSLFSVLVIVAVVHLIQGWRFGANSPAFMIMNILFLSGIVIVCAGTWVILRHVDWTVPFSIQLPFASTIEPQ